MVSLRTNDRDSSRVFKSHQNVIKCYIFSSLLQIQCTFCLSQQEVFCRSHTLTGMLLTVNALPAVSMFCIFIASMTATTCPDDTLSPTLAACRYIFTQCHKCYKWENTLTKMLATRPGMGLTCNEWGLHIVRADYKADQALRCINWFLFRHEGNQPLFSRVHQLDSATTRIIQNVTHVTKMKRTYKENRRIAAYSRGHRSWEARQQKFQTETSWEIDYKYTAYLQNHIDAVHFHLNEWMLKRNQFWIGLFVSPSHSVDCAGSRKRRCDWMWPTFDSDLKLRDFTCSISNFILIYMHKMV